MDSLPARIPVLTVRNPWAFGISHGGKPVENRGREMKYRGLLWLHAGARSRWDPAGADSPLIQTAWTRYVRVIPGWPGLPATDITLGRRTTLMSFGAVTALVEVRGCHWWEECRSVGIFAPEGTMCSPWAVPGQWHITLANVRPLPEPVSCRGALGLWRLPEDVEAQARKQLEASHA